MWAQTIRSLVDIRTRRLIHAQNVVNQCSSHDTSRHSSYIDHPYHITAYAVTTHLTTHDTGTTLDKRVRHGNSRRSVCLTTRAPGGGSDTSRGRGAR